MSEQLKSFMYFCSSPMLIAATVMDCPGVKSIGLSNRQRTSVLLDGLKVSNVPPSIGTAESTVPATLMPRPVYC